MAINTCRAYTCGFRINANLVKEGSFRINAKLVKEEFNKLSFNIGKRMRG